MRLSSNRLGLLLGHGLHESEARAYLALLEHPSLPAGTLAKLTQVPRSHLYKVLQDLHAEGLVDVLMDGKARAYRARPFAEYLQRRREEAAARLDALDAELRAVAPTLQPPPLDEGWEPDAGDVRIVLGRRAVAREVDDMVQAAREHVAFACSDRGLERALRHLAPLLDEPPSGGVDVEVFVPPPALQAGGLERLLGRPRVRVRRFRSPRALLWVAVDGARSLLVHPLPDAGDLRSGRDLAIASSDRVLLRDHLALLREATSPVEEEPAEPPAREAPAPRPRPAP